MSFDVASNIDTFLCRALLLSGPGDILRRRAARRADAVSQHSLGADARGAIRRAVSETRTDVPGIGDCLSLVQGQHG